METKSEQSDKSHPAPDSCTDAAVSFCSFPGYACVEGRTPDQAKRELYTLCEEHDAVILTGVDENTGTVLITAFPEGEYDPAAKVFLIRPFETRPSGVCIIASGSKDLPAALQARYALAACGAESTMVLMPFPLDAQALQLLKERLSSAAACIAVAGQDSALPGIAAGMTQVPVIALPVTTQKGSPLGGLMSLFGTLSSGAAGLTVVNADNGAGAGFAAARILNSQSVK